MPVATVPPVHIAPTIVESSFDLRRVPSAPGQPCKGSADEIIVCARRGGDRDRVIAVDDARFAAKPVKAEIGLTGALRGGMRVDQQEIGAGQISQRVLVGVKLPF